MQQAAAYLRQTRDACAADSAAESSLKREGISQNENGEEPIFCQ
jgi:hypothetical protein